MAAPGTSTCSPWAELSDLCSPCDDYAAGFDSGLLDDALQMASDVLYELTGRRWPGECSDTIRPCGRGSLTRWGNTSYAASNRLLHGWCGCGDALVCGCARLSAIRLPGSPVAAVTQVKIDGDVIPSTRYTVVDHRWLLYVPESDSAERRGWPCCQDIRLADTQDDTFSITYTYGQAPPLGGVRAAASLGCQLALACMPEALAGGKCQLPKRVTSITRQGITVAVLDPLTLFADGLTGLTDVDLWVAAMNMGRKRRRAGVYVPGATASHRRVGT